MQTGRQEPLGVGGPGMLVLEDGTVFRGEALGAEGTVEGELVFNTGMTGYGEILSDPSYCGQIVTLTYPLVGNYGVSVQDLESVRPSLRGLVVHEACSEPGTAGPAGTGGWGWSLDRFMRDHRLVGLQGVDTRALVRHLRQRGTMGAVLTSRIAGTDDSGALLELRERARSVCLRGVVYQVTCAQPYRISGQGPHVVVVDLGLKAGILRALVRRDCAVTVVPGTWEAQQIWSLGPAGVLFSNGPGDPCDAKEAIEAARQLLGRVPLFGICLGHQVMALAGGAVTYRLKYGHRGVNHPVRDLATGRVFITSQNHGFAVCDGPLAELGIRVTHRHVNDGTVEGIEFEGRYAFSVQYHPEARPGPDDSSYLFDRFLAMLTGD